MSTITFDTLKFANTLKDAGVPDKQAEAQARAQRESFSEAFDAGVAMRADIARLDANIKADIVRLENRMDSMSKDMQAMELRLTIKLGAFLAVFAGIIIAALKAF